MPLASDGATLQKGASNNVVTGIDSLKLAWALHMLVKIDGETENMSIKLKYRPVILEPLDDEMDHVPLAKRVY